MSDHCCSVQSSVEHNHALKKVLWAVFAINAVMFLLEIIVGYLYHSTALMADSLDMFSDAFVYGISIFVIAKSGSVKAKVSLIKGILMTTMAFYVIYELITKISNPIVPEGQIIAGVGMLAFVANAVCLWLLFRHKDGDINIRSAWVCSRNDMTANVGVIVAGVLVLYSGSQWPDYIIGVSVALLVLVSSFRVITDSLRELRSERKS
jgi:cation diffusion facilitator family transporter